MVCPYCQNQNRDGARFCAKCRQPLSSMQMPAQPQTPASPPPAPPSPSPNIPPVPPLPQPVVASPQPNATPARRDLLPASQWKSIGIGCGIFVLGMVCGMFALGGGYWGYSMLNGTSTPTATVSPSASATRPSGAGVPRSGVAEGAKPPAFTLKDLNGQDKAFLDMVKDKNAVLVFWKREQPRYDEMMATLQNYISKGLAVVAVTPRDDVTALKRYVLEEKKWDKITVLVNGEQTARLYNVSDYPTYFLFGKTGKIAKRLGAETKRDELDRELNDLLSK